jgi:hypothetical protein
MNEEDYVILCIFCNKPVDPNDPFTYRTMEALHRKGKKGGSDVVLRKDTGRYAHSWCADLERSGIHVEQQVLA